MCVFQGNVEKCREAEVRFHGEELKIYGERMTILQKAYNELLVLSNKRISDLHTLNDFISSAHAELSWLKEKEDKEVDRDWAESRNMKLPEVGVHTLKKLLQNVSFKIEILKYLLLHAFTNLSQGPIMKPLHKLHYSPFFSKQIISQSESQYALRLVS